MAGDDAQITSSTTPAASDGAVPAPPTEAMANLHLDQVTGEMVSKSELKKRQKTREREADRQQKAAAKAAAAPDGAVAQGPSEDELTPNQVRAQSPS